MVRRVLLASLAAGLAAAGAGCGGSGGGNGSDNALYSLEATRSCLKDEGYATAKLANRYLPGAGGNLRVHLVKKEQKLLTPGRASGQTARNYVFLVFGKDEAAARKTEQKALKLAVESLREGGRYVRPAVVKKGVGLTKNVFYYSASGALTQGQRKAVAACLR